MSNAFLMPCMLGVAIFSGASAFCTSYESLIVVRGLVGVFEGPFLPLAMAMLVSTASERMGLNSGLVNTGVGVIAVTFGPILVTQLVAYTSWQNTFLLASLPSFIVALVAMKLTKEVGKDPQAVAQQGAQTGSIAGNFASLFKYRNIIICILISITTLSAYWIMILFAPLYWVNVAHFPVPTMGFLVSAYGIAGIVYAIFIPKLTDNFGRKRVLLIVTAICIIGPLLMFLFKGNPVAMVGYVLTAGIPGAITPIFFTLIPMETVLLSLRISANALVMGLGDIIGGAFLPLMAGRVADAYGLSAMMIISIVALVIATILCYFLEESNSKILQKAAAK